ncbi:MAG: sialidase family protein [Betaproteobacteria bacterium]
MKKTTSMLIAAAVGLLLPVGTLFAGTKAPNAPTSHKWKFSPTINAPWAMEDDQEPLDSPIDAAGLCRSNPFTTTGAYGPLGSNVDVITGDVVNNSGFSNFGCTTPQNETTIAVNPTNANNLIAGANDYRVCCDFDGLNDGTGWAYYSTDAGATWKNVQLPKLTAETGATGVFKKFDSAGDPVIAFSPDGIAYYANIVFSRVSPASGVVVSVSSDGGKNWSPPNMVAYQDAGNFFLDKEWIGAGANGKVVVTWTRFNQGPHGASYLSSPIVGAISNDYGKTWNRQGFPISDAAHPFNQGSQVAFDGGGALYVAYEGSSPTTGYATDALVLARSTDDGRSFQTVELARVYDDLDCYPIYSGRQTLTDMHFRLNSYPSMSIDRVTGNIAITWTDNQGSGNCGTGAPAFIGTATANQVKLVSGTWPAIATAAVTAITTSAPDKVFPSVAAANGKTVVGYYTRDYGITSVAIICNEGTNDNPGSVIPPSPTARSVCMDYAAKTSTDAFGAQTRLSTESSNPFIQFANGSFIGDYTQVAISPNGLKAHAAWTDFRGNPGVTPANQDVMFQSFAP